MGLVRDWGVALVAAVLIFSVFAWFFGGGNVATGAAPALTGTDLDGEPFALPAPPDEPVLINFWAMWCGPCRAEIPEISAFASENPAIRVLGVSVDDAGSLARLRRFAKQNDMRYPVIHDNTGATGNAWGVSTLPTTFAVSADGHIADHHVGTLNRHGLARMLEQARGHAH